MRLRAEQRRDGPSQLLETHLDRVALEDVAELLQLGGEGAVGATVAVGKRAAADGATLELAHEAAELHTEARLPHAGLAENRDQVRPSLLDGLLPDSAQCIELAHAADERPRRQPALADWSGGLQGEPGGERRRLSLRDHRRCGLEDDRVARRGIGLLADEGRPHRPLGVVAKCSGRAEDGHHGVADELLHDTAERLDLPPDALVIGRQDRMHVLRIQPLGPRREPDEVDEDDADDASLRVRPGASRSQRAPAGEAETGDLRVLLTAGGTAMHVQRLRRLGRIEEILGSSACGGA